MHRWCFWSIFHNNSCWVANKILIKHTPIFKEIFTCSSCKYILKFSINYLFLSPNSFLLESGNAWDREWSGYGPSRWAMTKIVYYLPWDWSSFLHIHFGSSGTSHRAWLMVGTQYTFDEKFTCIAQYFLYSRSQMFIIFLLIMRYFVHQCIYNISTCKNITNWSPLCPPVTLRNRTFHYLWNRPHFHTIFIAILLRSWPSPWTFFISSFSLELCQIYKYS